MESDLNDTSNNPVEPSDKKSDLSSADIAVWTLIAILMVLILYLMIGICTGSSICNFLRRRRERQVHPFRSTNRYGDGQTLESVQITESQNGKSKLGRLSVASFVHEIPSSPDKSNVAIKHVFVDPARRFFRPIKKAEDENKNFEVDENNNYQCIKSKVQQAPNIQVYIATTSDEERSSDEEGEEEEEIEVPSSEEEGEILLTESEIALGQTPSFYDEDNPTGEEVIEEKELLTLDELEAQDLQLNPVAESVVELTEDSQPEIPETETVPPLKNNSFPTAEIQSVVAESTSENKASSIAENQSGVVESTSEDRAPLIADSPSVVDESTSEIKAPLIADNQSVVDESAPKNDKLPITESQGMIQSPSAFDNTLNSTYTESMPGVLSSQDTTAKTSGAAGHTMGTVSLLELSQMEGGWLREKVVNPGNSSQQEETNSYPADSVGTRYKVGEFLEPIQDFVEALAMSVAVSESCIADPGLPLDSQVGVYRTEAFTDQDQIEIRNEMDRLTTTRCIGTRTLLDFMQAEGSDWRYESGLVDRNAPWNPRDGCTDVTKESQIPNSENEAIVLHAENSTKDDEQPETGEETLEQNSEIGLNHAENSTKDDEQPETGEETLEQNSEIGLNHNEVEDWVEDEHEVLFQRLSQLPLNVPLPEPKEKEGEKSKRRR